MQLARTTVKKELPVFSYKGILIFSNPCELVVPTSVFAHMIEICIPSILTLHPGYQKVDSGFYFWDQVALLLIQQINCQIHILSNV